MELLQAIARITGLTYNEINIIVYYVLVPLLWAALLDWYIKLPVFAPLYLLFCLLVYLAIQKRFYWFSNKLFNLSQRFLLWFRKIGWNYVVSSVIICVVVPLIITVFLVLINVL